MNTTKFHHASQRTFFAGMLLFISLFVWQSAVPAQDANFYIYLCFGQSNMEGQGTIEAQDKTVDDRFVVLQAVDCSNLGRINADWYPAVPPLCRCWTGLSPSDYFGRTMVEYLPDSIRVGVVNISVAGCKIELFDRDNFQDYVATVETWMTNIINDYDGNPYQYLVETAKIAQQDGVIKGILLHQGESNTGDAQWPAKVKSIYENLLADLGLNAADVPLLAGEVVHADQGGACASMNAIIDKLPRSIPTAYVISSSGCTDAADNLHFNSAGYRELGRRYAAKLLTLMGYEVADPEEPETPQGTQSLYFEAECESIGPNWEVLPDSKASNLTYVTVINGIESLNSAAGDEGAIYIPFIADTTATYKVYGRMQCPSYDDDSFWVQMDNGNFVMINGLYTSSWQWMDLGEYAMEDGEHLLTITYREDGAKLDKICITNLPEAPTGLGGDPENSCFPVKVEKSSVRPTEFSLAQNYPNPFNPQTTIRYNLAEKAMVKLQVMDITGRTVQTLVNAMQSAGSYTIVFDGAALASGVYLYRLETPNFSACKKMNLLK